MCAVLIILIYCNLFLTSGHFFMRIRLRLFIWGLYFALQYSIIGLLFAGVMEW